jgi:acetyltransferase-like isoleucine patch superfamily enzyme
MNIFDMSKVEIGRFSYGELHIMMWLNPHQRLKIGNCVSVAPGVRFVLGGNHRTRTLSTYPFSAEIDRFELTSDDPTHIEGSNGPIIVGDDVWIGTNAMILSGSNIGMGAVIGACAVVTKDVPPYSIVAGNPAKVVRFRFAEQMIQKLLRRADYSKITLQKITELKNKLYEDLTEENFEEIIKVFDD